MGTGGNLLPVKKTMILTQVTVIVLHLMLIPLQVTQKVYLVQVLIEVMAKVDINN